MKKIILLLCSLCLCLGLVACGDDSNESTTSKSDKSNSSVDSSDDSLDDSLDDSSSEKETISNENISAKQEIIDATWYSGLVQVNDQMIQLPINLSELIELGFDYELYRGRAESPVEKDYLMSKDERVGLRIMMNGVEIASCSVANKTEEFKTVEEIDPVLYEICIEGELENISIFFPGGLIYGDSYKLIEEKYGKSREIKGSTYVYGNYDWGMEVEFDQNTQNINKIKTIKKDKTNVDNKLSTITIDGVGTKIMNKIEVLWPTQYKVMVDESVYETQRNDTRIIRSFILIDGNPYMVTFSFRMWGAEGYLNVHDNGEYYLNETNENGIEIKVYGSGPSFGMDVISSESVLNGGISFESINEETQVSNETIENMAIEIIKSIKFEKQN